MKKLMVMLAAVAMAASAMADARSLAYFTTYSADTNPTEANASWYSCYFMKVDAITTTTAGQVTSVDDYSGYATWLQSNFADNKAATIQNSQQLWEPTGAEYDSRYGQYVVNFTTQLFEGNVSEPYLAICFFDNGSAQAFKVIKQISNSFFMDDQSNFGSTDWIAVPNSQNIPEPTSGLMLLLGLAGLALKRKAV